MFFTLTQVIIFFSIIAPIILIYVYTEENDEIVYKTVDLSCYYCKYSKKPYSIRDKTKNTCNKINNRGWTSEDIKNCKYRIKN